MQLNAWNKAVVSRKNQLGLLTLNDALPVKGRSTGNLRELNLPQRLYLGGYPGGIYHPDSAVNAGLIGAIQRVHAHIEYLHCSPYNELRRYFCRISQVNKNIN